MVLFPSGATAFETQGLGSVVDAISCNVHEVLNGEYELEMQYPITGTQYGNLQNRRIIFSKHDPYSEPQPFRIYRITRPMNGIVTIYARHVSYAGQAEETLREIEQLADTVSGTIQQTGQEQVAAVQQAGQTQVSSVTQAGQEQITAVQQAGAQQTAAAAAEADRAKGYADSINPAQFVKTVNGTGPDSNGNVEVQAGVASVFGRTGAVTAQEGDYDAGQIDETSSRVFVSPQEKAKWNIPGDLINGTLSVWQRYNADDSTTYTNPSNAYIADRFHSNGTGTVKPNARGYGADITGTVTMQYWMEKSDFALLPDPVVVYYSVGGEMQSTSTAKTSVPTDSDGNACVFSRAITNQTLDWVSLYPGRPVRPYAEELALCQRYAVIYRVKNGSTFLFPGYGMNATSSRFTAQLPTPMRTKPTVTGTSLTAGASAPNEQAHNLLGLCENFRIAQNSVAFHRQLLIDQKNAGSLVNPHHLCLFPINADSPNSLLYAAWHQLALGKQYFPGLRTKILGEVRDPFYREITVF